MERFKSDVLLYIYNRLHEGKIVEKSDILDKFDINERTFYRYMKDIKVFIQNHDNVSIGEEVSFNRNKGGYILKGKYEKNINEKDVLAISKVILESRGFEKKEVKKMINKLLDNCVSEDKENVKKIIGNELINYAPPRHNKELLNKLWQISNAINKQQVLSISYYKVGLNGKLQEEILSRRIHPQGLLFSEYYFYLIAFIEGKSYEYPAVYRVDRIEELITTGEKYKVDYNKRFKDGEFRQLIQFMQTGKLETVKFRFTGRSIEAVLDRLPSAKVEKEKEGVYIVEAKMFGKGIKMWLLSQGEGVEIISSDKFREEMIETIEKMRKLYM